MDEQNLPEAYNEFCETSRHLTKEYLAYREGAKSIDTSIGLVNIISEYFLLKEKLNEFVRTCPKTKLILQLIDTSSIQLRLELIFNKLKENLPSIDGKVVEDTVLPRKRKKADGNESFDICHTNTSTPDSSHPQSQQPLKKRRKISLTTPFISLSASNNSKQLITDKNALNRKELQYISSPETSNKEDDVSDDDEIIEDEEDDEEDVDDANPTGTKINPLPPEFLSETILDKKPDFAENLAEIINKTRSAKEHESTEASTSSNALTQTDVQDILSKTENDFEDILNEMIHKYLDPKDDKSKEDQQLPSTSSSTEIKPNEIPIKQRLRPRSVKKAMPLSEKAKKKKFNIIANEAYTGPLPACVHQPSTTSTPIVESLPPPPIYLSLVPTSIFQSTSTFQLITAQDNLIENLEVVMEEAKVDEIQPETDKENKQLTEKVQMTPKIPMNANFLESKCKSTPRRKATHVRILDFNHTPRLSTLKECTTPSNGIRMETPGSAPASVNLTKERKKEVETIEIIDESSNSTSISHTPKVAKNRRRRKIEIDSKKSEESPIKEPPMTREEWDKMRAEQKSLSVDQRMRLLISKEKDVKDLTKVKKRKTPKKKNNKIEANGKANGSSVQVNGQVK